MKHIKKFESHNDSMSREEMCDYLCKCGYEMEELEACPNHELEEMCRMAQEESSTNEAKKEKWIQSAIKRPGALRKKMGKGEEEKLTKAEIEKEISKLKKKDKDPDKKGTQGLSKADLRKLRQLNLAKTLKKIKEHQETENYMFFANLETICRLADELLHMDQTKVDAILSDGHGWATDHIATSKDDIEEVFNFLKSHDDSHVSDIEQHHSEPSHEETEGHLANKDLESEMKNIKTFGSF